MKSANKPELFVNAKEQSVGFSETNDCSVIALAIVTGKTYAECHAALKVLGRKERNGTTRFCIENAVELLGFEFEKIDSAKFISQYPGVHKNLQNVTTFHPARFHKVFQSSWIKNNNYLFYTSNHVSALKDGALQDWAAIRGFKVERIVKIYRKVK